MTSTAENVQTPSPLARRWTVRSFASTWASQIGITVAFVVLWVAFIVLAPDTFLDNRIYISFAQTTPCFALPALLLTMVIVSGDIDLSFPSIMGLGMVGFIAVERTTGNVALAVLTALAVGALAGLLNGGLRHPHRHPGAGRHDRHAVPVPRADARLGQRPELRPRGSEDSEMSQVLIGRLLGVPMQFVWLVLVAIGTWVLLYRHRLGQNGHVIGDNRPAAQLMGIPIRRTRTIMFVLVGIASAFATAGTCQVPPRRGRPVVDKLVGRLNATSKATA
jgi:simple sugar transport system permease protein